MGPVFWTLRLSALHWPFFSSDSAVQPTLRQVSLDELHVLPALDEVNVASERELR